MRDDEFFKNVPIKTLEKKGLSVEFPILYYDFRFVTCIFAVKIQRLKSILPHPQFTPIQKWPGTGMIGIAAFEYRDTSIGPYKEVAIVVPINFPQATFLGKHTAHSMMRQKIFPVYIHHLPVTTKLALDVGVYFYNYPKFLAEIDFQERQDLLEIELKEGNDPILKMSVKNKPLKKSAPFEIRTFSLEEKMIMHTLVKAHAAKYGQVKFGKCGELELGSHRISNELKNLDLSKFAWSGFFGEGTMSRLYDPDRQWDKDTMNSISSDI
jgi:hypothetical protein